MIQRNGLLKHLSQFVGLRDKKAMFVSRFVLFAFLPAWCRDLSLTDSSCSTALLLPADVSRRTVCSTTYRYGVETSASPTSAVLVKTYLSRSMSMEMAILMSLHVATCPSAMHAH